MPEGIVHAQQRTQVPVRTRPNGGNLRSRVSGYLSTAGSRALVGQALDRIQGIRENVVAVNGHAGENLEKLDALERKLGNFQARRAPPPFQGVRASEVAAYRKVFQALAEASQSPRAAKEMIEAILARA